MNSPIFTTSCGVLWCSVALRGIASNIAPTNFVYHLSKSVRRSVFLNIASAVFEKSYSKIPDMLTYGN